MRQEIRKKAQKVLWKHEVWKVSSKWETKNM